MNPEQQIRYSRQIKLRQVGETGQQKLLESKVLIVGIGGLGSPVSMYLAAAGVGRLVLTDYDQVDASNLQRQIAHSNSSIGHFKAASARETILRLNPEVEVLAIDYELDGKELVTQAEQVDVLIDCTDNFPSRFELNRVSLLTGTPLVSGAAIRWEGQISTFAPKVELSPCYQCLYPDVGLAAASCAMEGVIAPIVGVVGSIQAMEVINLLLKTGDGLVGRVLVFDGIAMEWQSIKLDKNSQCPACSIKI
jgi:molybdopterin/thiamine biosynthesis adenylyltransferase